MSTTNHTTNYELSQYIGTDVTSYLSNYNSDMYKIDAQMKENADDAAEAKSDAASAVSTATSAASSASAAVSTANAANTAAEAAQTAATAAQTAAGTAQTDAAAALRASASNTIGNLAPAYDPTLTYAVGDLVTYVDPETNQGKLYKCIIAIAVPEEFNINKWDDVTTSEVYNKQPKVFEFDHNDFSSLSDLYTAIYNALGNAKDAVLFEGDTYFTNFRLAGRDTPSNKAYFVSSIGTQAVLSNRYIVASSTASNNASGKWNVAGTITHDTDDVSGSVGNDFALVIFY